MTFTIKKTIYSILGVMLGILAITGTVDQKGEWYTEQAFNRALITFGVARGLNGVISVAQGTEVAIHPAGFGVNFTPGEILDPINDIVEQFSWIMLASTASLGVQRIFLNISSSIVSSIVLIVLIVVAVLLVWYPAKLSPEIRTLLNNFLLVMIFIRFSVPLAAIGSELLYDWFLSDQYLESTQHLERTKDTIKELNKQGDEQFQATENETMVDKAKRWFDSAASNVDIEARIEEYKEAATDASRHAINLIVVFIIQTVIFPLMFLWIIYRFLRDIGRKII